MSKREKKFHWGTTPLALATSLPGKIPDYDRKAQHWIPSQQDSFLLLFKFSSFLQVITISSVQFSSVIQSHPTLCDPMNCSTYTNYTMANSWHMLSLSVLILTLWCRYDHYFCFIGEPLRFGKLIAQSQIAVTCWSQKLNSFLNAKPVLFISVPDRTFCILTFLLTWLVLMTFLAIFT